MWYRLSAALLLFALTASSASSADGLVWTRPLLEATAQFGDRDVTAEYAFKNVSDHTITITGLDTSCSCTLAELDKRAYAPGESGRVGVDFEVGDQTGLCDELIFVTTDETPPKPTRLELKVRIPEYLHFEPAMVLWPVGVKPAEKIITCTAQSSRAVALTAAESNDPGILVQLETVSPGSKYRLHIKPVSTAQPISATIKLDARVAGYGKHVFHVQAYVNGP